MLGSLQNFDLGLLVCSILIKPYLDQAMEKCNVLDGLLGGIVELLLIKCMQEILCDGVTS